MLGGEGLWQHASWYLFRMVKTFEKTSQVEKALKAVDIQNATQGPASLLKDFSFWRSEF